jgi:hypothetical protein
MKEIFIGSSKEGLEQATHSYKKETAQPRVGIVGGGFGGL